MFSSSLDNSDILPLNKSFSFVVDTRIDVAWFVFRVSNNSFNVGAFGICNSSYFVLYQIFIAMTEYKNKPVIMLYYL